MVSSFSFLPLFPSCGAHFGENSPFLPSPTSNPRRQNFLSSINKNRDAFFPSCDPLGLLKQVATKSRCFSLLSPSLPALWDIRKMPIFPSSLFPYELLIFALLIYADRRVGEKIKGG